METAAVFDAIAFQAGSRADQGGDAEFQAAPGQTRRRKVNSSIGIAARHDPEEIAPDDPGIAKTPNHYLIIRHITLR